LPKKFFDSVRKKTAMLTCKITLPDPPHSLPGSHGTPMPKTSKFRGDFGQLRDLVYNIFGTQQDRPIVNRKTALQATITPG